MLTNTTSNFSSREAVHYQQLHSNDYNDTISRLASGKKINNTGDDPSIRSSISTISRDLHANKDLHSDINNSKALLSSVDIYIDEQLNDMSDVKENLLRLQSDNLEDFEKKQIKLETRTLLDKIDTTANIARYNDLSLLNGELKDSTFQIGIKSFERLKIDLPSTQTNNLGEVRFETGSTIKKAGDVDIVFKVSNTKEYSLGTVSIGANKGSGIGKLSELINSSQQQVGQQAFYDVTTTGINEIKQGRVNALVINGITIGDIDVQSEDSNNNLINAINKVSNETGVIASKDSDNKLLLNSPDGRGIEVLASVGLNAIGINDTNAKNYGKLTLVSIDKTRASIGSPELLGFTQTDNFIFSTRDMLEKNLSKDKISSLGAYPNSNTNLDKLNDILDSKNVLKSFSFLADNAIDNLNDIKSDIGFALTKLTESQDRIFDLNNILKNSIDDKENIDYAEEIYNKEKFSNLLSSSSYALSNSLLKQKDILDELFTSIKDG